VDVVAARTRCGECTCGICLLCPVIKLVSRRAATPDRSSRATALVEQLRQAS